MERDEEIDGGDADGPPSRQVTIRPTARLIDGRYQLEELIGRGGFGEVYAAHDERTLRHVAVKLFGTPWRADAAAERESFLKEATRTAAVAHPCVVKVYDAGLDHGAPFLVMELLQGITVGQRIAARGAMSSARALRIADQMLRGLIHIHAANLLHGDLKPSNVFLTRSHHVKLIDFGISRRCADQSDENEVRGTPPYVPPEVILGDPADERSDVYGVGLVLYTMLAGRPAFELRANVVQTFHEVLAGRAPTLDTHRPDLPPALVALVARAMARAPEARFASAATMRAALEPLLDPLRDRVTGTTPAAPEGDEGD